MQAETADAMLRIDGTEGEGGGQVLRTALGLSLLTQQPVQFDGIRGRRRTPGLQKEHLACVRAAAEVGMAEVHGAHPGSTALSFAPTGVRAGTYEFSVGAAGSALLVLQTVLPALLTASAPSVLHLRGHTHGPLAPSFDFASLAFANALRHFGGHVELALHRHGFSPHGGGHVEVKVTPTRALQPASLLERANPGPWRARVLLSRLPTEIGERQLDHLLGRLRTQLRFEQTALERIEADGPADVLVVEQPCAALTEVLCAHGERGLPAEQLADRLATEALMFGAANVPVGPFLADQLLIPMAMARGGEFRTVAPTRHSTTNAALVERFLPVSFGFVEDRERSGTFVVRCDGRN